MKTSIPQLLASIESAINHLQLGQQPAQLYDPIRYIMNLGGKRLRPLLTLLSYSLFKEQYQPAVKPAVAVEFFHNFTLMHDDIMDEAPLRRGKDTVHQKWNKNVAILSGDVMVIQVYNLLLDLEDRHLKPVLEVFNQCAIQVCEGQQIDMMFEDNDEVSESNYLEMIGLKTATLLGFCMELGGILADVKIDTQKYLKNFGIKLGISFQLKDDLLDIFGDQGKFGKQVGGDIISNKKTFLLIKALELAQDQSYEELKYWMGLREFDKNEKVDAVTKIYHQLNINDITEQKMNSYFKEAFDSLNQVDVPSERKSMLISFTEKLMHRES